MSKSQVQASIVHSRIQEEVNQEVERVIKMGIELCSFIR